MVAYICRVGWIHLTFGRFKAESFWISNIHLVSVTDKSGNVARSGQQGADGWVGEDCLELE